MLCDVCELPGLPCDYWKRARGSTDVARPRWRAEDQPGVRARTSGGNKDKDNDDDQGGDIPAWMFKKSNQEEETNNSAPKKRDSKKKPVQPKGNDNRARWSVKDKGGAIEEECVAGPVVMRVQVKKSDKAHSLKVKEAISSVDKSTLEDLQKKDSTLKQCLTS